MDEHATATLTIDQLAQRTGMTVRNIRAHQTRGLLPPPVVRARTGYYGPEHVARIQLIREMQDGGFNLGAIRRVLEMAPAGTGEELLQLERLLTQPWVEERPEIVDVRELADRFGDVDAKALRKAEALGILQPLGDGRFEVPSPSLLRAGQQVVEIGVPLDHALAVVEKVQRHARGVAREFVRLFLQDVWQPFDAAGMPQEQLPMIRKSLERLRSLASDVLVASFSLAMTDAVDAAFGKQLEKGAKRRRGG